MKFYRASSVIGANGKTVEPKVETFVPRAEETESGEFVAMLPNGGTMGPFGSEEDAILSAEESLRAAYWTTDGQSEHAYAQRLADQRNAARLAR